MLDGPKMKADILNLFKTTSGFVTREDLSSMFDQLRRVQADIADVNYDMSNVKELVAKLEKQLENQIAKVNDNVSQQKTRIDNLENVIAGLKKNLSLLSKKNPGANVQVAAADPGSGAVNPELEEMLNQLRADHEALKSQQSKDHNDVCTELDKKANKSDLDDLEMRLMQRLNDLLNQLKDQFADKEVCRKKFKDIYDKIRALNEALNLKQANGPTEDDAMFTKKYVGPVNCASCEKGIVNLCGSPVDYHVWKRLPFREPSERIARYGQGFSKILTMMRPSDSNSQLMQQNHSALERAEYHRGSQQYDFHQG